MSKKKIWIPVLFVVLVVAMAMGFTACGSDKNAPHNLSYDGEYITWDAVKKAKYYTVSINGGDTQTSDVNSFYYGGTGDFDVTVTTCMKKKEASASVSFKQLRTIDKVAVGDDGVISWDSVSGATDYLIYIEDDASPDYDTVQTSDTTYSSLPAGTQLTVKVRPTVAKDNSYYSLWSPEKSLYIYSEPANIKYDDVENLFTWEGRSDNYLVTVNGVEYSVYNTTSLSFEAIAKDLDVSVKSVGDHEKTFDSSSLAKTFHYMNTVKNINVVDGIIEWEEISDASYYKLRLSENGNKSDVIRAYTNSYEDAEAQILYEVEVMPASDDGDHFSTWSSVKTIYILPAPNSSWNGDYDASGEDESNNFYWDAVTSAASYMVRITYPSGQVETQSTSNLYYGEKYDQTGTYTLEVKAQAGGGNLCDSKYSSAITVTRLASPTLLSSGAVTSDPLSLSAGFTVAYNKVDGASSYALYEEDNLVATSVTTNYITHTNIAYNANGDTITYKLRSNGSAYDETSRSIVLGSLVSTATSFTITVLATPTNVTMQGYTMSWSAVSGASKGYSVTYGETVLYASSISYDLSLIETGTTQVYVCARGDGSATLASAYSNALAIYRLEAPKEISIISEGNGTLKHTDVQYANSYTVYLDGGKETFTESTANDMYSKISTTGTTLSIVADANYWKEDRTVYYMSSPNSESQQFIKLEAPTFSSQSVIAADGQLNWSAPKNSGEYTPTYSIYLNLYGSQSGTSQETSYDISSWEANSYTVYIKAVGNETKYVDSDYSAAITFTKLEAPDVKRENGSSYFSWQAISSATYYEVDLGDGSSAVRVEQNTGTITYAPTYTSMGNYTVTVRAMGDGVSTVGSQACTMTQSVQQLAQPQVTQIEYSESCVSLGVGYFKLTLSTVHTNCSGYMVYAGGASNFNDISDVSAESCAKSHKLNSTGAFDIYIVAVGGVFDASGVYYIDSIASESQTWTLLATPTESSFAIDDLGYLNWEEITGAMSYTLTIKIGNATYTVNSATNTYWVAAHFSGNTIPSGTQIEVQIQALGSANGKSVTSALSDTYTIIKS